MMLLSLHCTSRSVKSFQNVGSKLNKTGYRRIAFPRYLCLSFAVTSTLRHFTSHSHTNLQTVKNGNLDFKTTHILITDIRSFLGACATFGERFEFSIDDDLRCEYKFLITLLS